MTTLIRNIPVNAALGTRSLLWLVAFGSLAVLLALLTKIISTTQPRLRTLES